MKNFIKKSLFFLTVFAFFFLIANTDMSAAKAAEVSDKILVSYETEVLEDGSYLVSELYQQNSNQNARATETIVGERVVTKYSASDKLLWTYTLIGYFTVFYGVSSECYHAEYVTDIQNNSWSFSDGYIYYNEDTAYGEGTFTYRILGIKAQTVNIDVYIACDINGNLY